MNNNINSYPSRTTSYLYGIGSVFSGSYGNNTQGDEGTELLSAMEEGRSSSKVVIPRQDNGKTMNNNINSYLSSSTSYLYGIGSVFSGPYRSTTQGDEGAELLSSMEEGKSPSGIIVPRPDPVGTVRIPSSVISNSDRARMVDQDPEARAAAGDASKFLARFKSLLIDQYKDKDGHTRIVIGMAIYKILGAAEPENGVASIIDPKTATDVGLIADAAGKTVTSEMDRTFTKTGNAYFQLAITRPDANLDVVIGYQKVIRALLEDESISGQLRSALEKMPEGEINLISCQDTRKQLPGSTTALYYNIDPKVNEILNMSSLALDMSFASTTIKKVTNTTIQCLATVVLPTFAALQMSRAFGGPSGPEFLKAFATRFTGSTPAGALGSLMLAADIPVINAVVTATAGAYSGLSVRSTCDWLVADTSILPLMRDQLSSIATYYKEMKTIHAALKDHPEITSNLKHFQN